MSARRLRLRLQNPGRRLCACAYADVAALWCASLGPAEEARLERRVWHLGDLGAAHGAPLEAGLARLPPGLVGGRHPPPRPMLAAGPGRPAPRPSTGRET